MTTANGYYFGAEIEAALPPNPTPLKPGDVVRYKPGIAAVVDEVGPIFAEHECSCGYEHDYIVLEPWQARIHMVGDDRTIEIDFDEVEVINDDDYCGDCGQIGCGWGR